MLLLAVFSCQKEDFTFTENEARITNIVETGVSRNNGSDAEQFPYRISFTLDAVLNDISDIQEWGVYFVDTDNNPLEYRFKEIAPKGTINLYLNTIPEFLHKGDIALEKS